MGQLFRATGPKAMSRFEPTPHPLLKLPTREQALKIGPEELRELLLQCEEIIRLEKEDPWEHGFYLDSWKDADAWLERSTQQALLGGNGSAKTHYMCRKAVQMALDNPGCKILMLHEEEEPSKILHQAIIFHYLPKQLKELTLFSKRSKINTGF